VATIRYYERRGLLQEPQRPRAGYRVYAQRDVAGRKNAR
jgi:DNA-binding transcriptional MerR regulator